MADNIFERLRAYYEKVGAVLRDEAEVASIFPNASDIGTSRERVYAEFLRQLVPSKCNVFRGGFVFAEDGSESKQLDVIVTTDTTPRFDFPNPDGSDKSFAPVEGTLAVASIKSTLNKQGLFNALEGIASIPESQSLEGRLSPTFEITDYEDWPYKIIYATKGVSLNTLIKHLVAFYAENQAIPMGRRPNIIHVSGKYLLQKRTHEIKFVQQGGDSEEQPEAKEILEKAQYIGTEKAPDLQGILWVLQGIQRRSASSAHIFYDYGYLINSVQGIEMEVE